MGSKPRYHCQQQMCMGIKPARDAGADDGKRSRGATDAAQSSQTPHVVTPLPEAPRPTRKPGSDVRKRAKVANATFIPGPAPSWTPPEWDIVEDQPLPGNQYQANVETQAAA